jgi:sugar lactone lactonase YvrE
LGTNAIDATPVLLSDFHPTELAGANMPTHKLRNSKIAALALLCVFTFGSTSFVETSEIALPSARAYPESVASAPDGTLYVGSPAVGGVWRIKTSSGTVEEWIKPGAFGSRSTLGLLVDNKANLLWVCSNDFSSIGIPGPSSVTGSFVKGFDLSSGEGRVNAALPGKATLCNDMALGAGGSLFVTNSLAPQILRLKPGSDQLDVWLESPAFEQPPGGAPGLDGIAFGGDGNLYVNTFAKGDFFRIEIKDGAPGKITKLQTSRSLKLPDGLRSTGGQTFVMAEGGGTVDRISVNGDSVDVQTIKDGIAGPTSVALVGQTLWVAEGQLSHLFEPAKSGPPHLPFKIIGVAVQGAGGHDSSEDK